MGVGLMHLTSNVFKLEQFEKKFSNIYFQRWVKKYDFLKIVKNCSTLTKCSDQTGEPRVNYKVSLERQCLYLSSGTLGFEICQAIESQWFFENDGPLRQVAENE